MYALTGVVFVYYFQCKPLKYAIYKNICIFDIIYELLIIIYRSGRTSSSMRNANHMNDGFQQ